MAIFRGVGGSGDSSDNSFLQEVTAQANAASASASAASASAVLAQASANSILTLTAATGDAGTDVSYNASTGVLTVPRGADGTDASVTAANVTGVLTGGTGISIASNGTITNDSPDQTVALAGTGATTITGTYPNFTINSVNTTYTVGDGGLTTNDFTDADHTKLNGIEANATADQTGAEIKSAYEAVADTNAFTDAEKTKLSGIEASADVTDTANVTAAGALMDSEVTNLAQVKAFDSSDYATSTQGTTADNALPKAGGQMTGNITFSGTQTVDGRDVSADGAALDAIPYHRIEHHKIMGDIAPQPSLTSSNSDLGQMQTMYHRSTPVATTRYVDVDFITDWAYVSSAKNDVLLSLYLTVPSGATTTTLGTITYVPSSTQYQRRGSGEEWYYVTGDHTHLLSDFCKLSPYSDGNYPSSGTPIHAEVRAYQYVASLNRTYMLLYQGIYTSLTYETGDTLYLHPYAWESAGTEIYIIKRMGERYAQGFERQNFNFKLGHTTNTLSFKLKAREESTSDYANVRDGSVRLTSMGL